MLTMFCFINRCQFNFQRLNACCDYAHATMIFLPLPIIVTIWCTSLFLTYLLYAPSAGRRHGLCNWTVASDRKSTFRGQVELKVLRAEPGGFFWERRYCGKPPSTAMGWGSAL